MIKNMCGIDRILRIGIGLLMIYLGSLNTQLVTDSLARGTLVTIGVILILIAIIAFCPLYILIDFSSLPKKKLSD